MPQNVSMLSKTIQFLRIILRVLKEVAVRTRDSGWRSGWTCVHTRARNARRRLQNCFRRSTQAACPCCGWEGYGFLHIDCGKFAVPDAVCPRCQGHERHRLMHLFLTRRPPEFMGMQEPGWVLHFAPERQIRQFVEANPYLSILSTDFVRDMVRYAPRPGVQADIQRLPLRDESVDGIFNLHVLEHIPDDRQGVREMHRVLKPDGQAVIVAPFMMDQSETIEYGAPDPHMFDHVRGYSPLDFKHRLAPFVYEEVMPGSFLTVEELKRYRIPHDSQVIYVCRKR